MDTEKKVLMKIAVEQKSLLESISETVMNARRLPKPASRSEEIRKKGNDLFLQKSHDAETHREIFSHYCKSISLAPLESKELAQAYGNRSAFLMHIQKYEDCIKDIDRALKITKPDDVLRVKLLCRKVECMKKMALPNFDSVLEAAENGAKDVGSDYKIQVDKLIDKAKNCSISSSKVSTKQPNDFSPQVDQTLNCVSIEHNKKYGRHLVSKKDYNPGDFIFVDDPYVTVLNPEMNYTNCNYCLKICWSGIACDHCSWAMFCNEDCRKKAWDSFHDVECSMIFYMRNALFDLLHTMQMSLRILLVGIREAGGIKNLKEELKKVEQCTDNSNKGFYKNTEFASCTIQSVYSLKSSEKFKLEGAALAALTVLVAMIKHSHLIPNFNSTKIVDIMANEDLVFLGSLLIKFTAISRNNCHTLTQLACYCKRLKCSSGDFDNLCCARGSSLIPLASLMNHSCNPNASMIFSEGNKITIYALQPIKKNSQIFITYAGFYYNKLKKDRIKILDSFNFTCKCQACTKSWPPIFSSPELSLTKQSELETKLLNDCANIFAALDTNKMDFTKKDINKLCKTIVQAKRLPEPTVLSATLKPALGEIYSRVYGWEPPIHAFRQCN